MATSPRVIVEPYKTLTGIPVHCALLEYSVVRNNIFCKSMCANFSDFEVCSGLIVFLLSVINYVFPLLLLRLHHFRLFLIFNSFLTESKRQKKLYFILHILLISYRRPK